MMELSMISKIKNFINIEKYRKVITIFFLLLFIVLISSIFIKEISTIALLLLSIVFCYCLFTILQKFYKKYITNSEKSLFFIVFFIVSIITLVGYIYIVYFRNYIYFDDHVVYYNQQLELRNVFSISPAKGFYAILSSCWFSDYSYFINVILDLPFFLSSGSNDIFVICYVIFMIIPSYFAGNIFIFDFSKELAYTKRLLFILLSNLLFVTFPLFHMASILGMPDVFGLFFVFLIMTELFNYDYNLFSFRKTFSISVLIILLIITRRWYLFWVLGFVSSVILVEVLFSIVKCDHKEKKRVFLNNIKTLCAILSIIIIPLIPFIYKTLFVRNYSNEYTAWYIGGFPYEIYNQIGYLGILLSVVLLVGLIYGLINDKLRIRTIVSTLGLFISIFAFTRIQNMGKHQSLCLMGYYLVFAYDAIYLITELKKRILKSLCIAILVTILLLNIISTFTGYYDDLDGIFPTTKYAIVNRFSWK